MNRRIVDDLVGGYLYLGVMALVTLFVVPIYVRWLGPAAWGSVAWCLTLQGVLFSFDAVFAPLMMRDVARAASTGSVAATYAHHARRYARGAVRLFVLGEAILLLFALAGPKAGSADTMWALQLALVQVLFQFANLSAVAYWVGRQRQQVANVRLATFAVVKHALALGLIAGFGASAVAYLVPFVLVGVVECLANRRHIRRALEAEPNAAALPHAPEARGELAVHALAALLAIATSQVDRILLSIALPADAYGRYFLLSSLLLSLLHLQMPLSRTFLPRIATATHPARVVRRTLWFAALGLAAPTVAVAFQAERVLFWWLGDPVFAAEGAPTLRVLLVAGALLVISGPVTLQWLSEHRYRRQAWIQSAMLVLQAAAILVLLPRIGMLSGAMAWLLAALVQGIGAAYFLFRDGADEAARARPAGRD